MCCVLLLLDLSAAFDTVDHDILLTRLHSKYSISGIALEWFRSYLTNRSQFALIEGCRSQSRELKCGVPQGSVLVLILYVLHTAPLADILRFHEMQFLNLKTYGSRAFSVSAPELWKKLPDDIRSCENMSF